MAWRQGQWFGDPSISPVEDYRFGFYGPRERDWDEIAYNAPYYLIVKSAGNDRGDNGAGVAEPDGGADGYDCVSTPAPAKNIITVGAVNDLPNGYTGAPNVIMTSFSGWEPTDDGRVKPDVVGNGTSLLSLGNGTNDYTNRTGTSMATPSMVIS